VKGSGGAIFARLNELKITDGNFESNTCKSFGGAIDIRNYSDINLLNVNFTKNTALDFGGSIYLLST